MTLRPTSIEALTALVPERPRLRLRGGGTKEALSTPGAETSTLDLSALAGITEHTPEECTFTALGGTRIADIDRALAAHGQYLPFDPPLAAAGATIGGAVAAGVNGSCRYRFGGIRDFLIGARIVDGRGQVIQSGGKVVKNAAGLPAPSVTHRQLRHARGSCGVDVQGVSRSGGARDHPGDASDLAIRRGARTATCNTRASISRPSISHPPARYGCGWAGFGRRSRRAWPPCARGWPWRRASPPGKTMRLSGGTPRASSPGHPEACRWCGSRYRARSSSPRRRARRSDAVRRYTVGGNLALIAWNEPRTRSRDPAPDGVHGPGAGRPAGTALSSARYAQRIRGAAARVMDPDGRFGLETAG